METVLLEPLEKPDIPAVLELLERCGLPHAGVLENPGAFVVAKQGDQVIGCAGVEVHGADGLLRSVAVAPVQRGRGIAASIVQHLARRAEREGLTSLYLLTSTARDYFARLGFEPCARGDAPSGIRSSWEFRSGCPATAAFMRRQVCRANPALGS